MFIPQKSPNCIFYLVLTLTPFEFLNTACYKYLFLITRRSISLEFEPCLVQQYLCANQLQPNDHAIGWLQRIKSVSIYQSPIPRQKIQLYIFENQCRHTKFLIFNFNPETCQEYYFLFRKLFNFSFKKLLHGNGIQTEDLMGPTCHLLCYRNTARL